MLTMRSTTLAGMIFLAAASRLVPHPPNFAPIAAMALFGGARFADRRAAFLVPLAAMFIGDLLIGLHGLMPVVYGSFALIVCMGLWLRRREGVHTVAGTALAGSILFFVATNFGVWALSSSYPKTAQGLVRFKPSEVPDYRALRMTLRLSPKKRPDSAFSGDSAVPRWPKWAIEREFHRDAT